MMEALQDWLEGWLDAAMELLGALIDNVIEWFDSVFRALLDLIYRVLSWAFVDVLGLVTEWVQNVERPELYEQAESIVCDSFNVMGGLLSLDFGGPLAFVFAGLALRFLIRRIPIIG